MLRSLVSGVTGLMNHQMKMDVLGNNIANISTVGYKSGRINFSDALFQTLSSATPSHGTGYINPMQVGLGMKVASIENLFSQGSLENTGVETDMAIEGDGFFVVDTGDSHLYTRAGQFYFNSDGRLVNQRGLAVQGWMLYGASDTMQLGAGNIGDIVVDPNLISDAVATENVSLTGNLNSGLETNAEVWSLNTALTEAGVNATAASDLNNLDQTTTALVAGDTIAITGTNPDGTVVGATYTYAAGDTVQELLDAINAAYTGATATIANGQIVLTDTVAGESSTTIGLANGAANTGEVDFDGFVNTTAGVTGTTTTSVVVYDSLGASHNLVLEFTKTVNDGEWTWTATSGSDETIISGGSGQVTFDSAGNMVAFTYNGGVNSLTMNPGNGANQMIISLHAETDEEYAGLSQYQSLSSLSVRSQDGNATGRLLGIDINKDGTITGSFTNGLIEEIAKVAIAKFPTNAGLADLGDSLYKASIASGDPQIVELKSDNAESIVSGALEMSNVDLSKEFTEMITAQRGFQASAKVITTADTILDELLRLKR
jgi:flagellar hook protein FlgE